MKKIKIVLGRIMFQIFNRVYAPQIGRTAQEIQEFWVMLEDETVGVPVEEGVFVGGPHWKGKKKTE